MAPVRLVHEVISVIVGFTTVQNMCSRPDLGDRYVPLLVSFSVSQLQSLRRRHTTSDTHRRHRAIEPSGNGPVPCNHIGADGLTP